MLGAGDEVGEGVGFLGLAAIQEPTPALVGPAAHMGDGPDPSPVHQAEIADRKAGLHGMAVGAVAVEQQGGCTVQRRALQHQHGDRHQLAVWSRGHHPPGHIARRVVTRGDFLGLAQGSLARGHIVVEGLSRGRRRLVDEAGEGGRVLIATL